MASTARSVAGLSVLAIISPLAGLAVEMALAWSLGASPTADAYRVGALIVALGNQLFIWQLLPNGIVPVVAEYRAAGDEAKGWTVALSTANLFMVPTLLITAVLVLWAEPVVHLLGPGLSPEAGQTATRFVRWFSLTYVPFIWTGTTAGLLYAYRIFWLAPASQIIANLVFAGVLIGFGAHSAVTAVVVGVLAAAALRALLHVLHLAPLMSARHARFPWSLGLSDSGTRKILSLSLPLLATILLVEWGDVATYRALSVLPSGAVASYGYAWKLVQLVSLLPGALATVLFPRFADAWNSPDRSIFRDVCTRGLRVALFLALPLSVATFLLRAPIVVFLLRRGALTASAASLVAALFGGFAVGAPAYVAWTYLTKVAYAAQAPRAAMFVQLIYAGAMALLARPVAVHFGSGALVLLCATLQWICAASLLLGIQRGFAPFALGDTARSLAPLVAAILPAIIVGRLVISFFGTLVSSAPIAAGLAILGGGGTFFVTFLISAVLFGSDEAGEVRARLVRFATPKRSLLRGDAAA